MNDAPKPLVVLSIFLAILTLAIGWIGFHKVHDKRLLGSQASAKGSTQAKACQCERCSPKAEAQKPAEGSTQPKACLCESCIPQDEVHSPYIDVANKTLQLFFANSDFESYDALDFPGELTFATCTGYAAVLLITIWLSWETLGQYVREQRLLGTWWLRFCFTRPTAVVFNLRDNFRHLIPEFAAKHRRKWLFCTIRPVVIALPDLKSPLAKACKDAGLWVVEASPYDSDLLKRLAVAHASEVYIFGDDSTANLDLALRCQSSLDNHGKNSDQKSATFIYVEIEDPDVHYALQPHTVGSADSLTAIVTFSLAVTTARRAVSGGQLATLPGSTFDPDRPADYFKAETKHILMGSGRYLRAFFNEVIKSSVVDRQKKITLHIISPDALALQSRLRAEIPAWDLLHANICFHPTVDAEPEAHINTLRPLISQLPNTSEPLNFYCLLPDDGNNLSLAARLTTVIGNLPAGPALCKAARILFLCRESPQIGALQMRTGSASDFGPLAEEVDKGELGELFLGCRQENGPCIRPIGLLSECASLREINQWHLIEFAYRIHQGYTFVSSGKAELKGRPAASAAFQKLSLIKREQNFAQADHIDIKLARLGALHFTPENLREHINRELPEGWKIHGSLLPDHAIDDASPFQATLPVVDIMEESQRVTSDRKFDLYRTDNEFGAVIRELAELEHLRWMQVHALAGFSDHRESSPWFRRHHCLLPFDDEHFPSQTIPYDIEATRLLPLLVSLRKQEEPLA